MAKTSNDLVRFFSLQRQIFGICPHSGQFFRLSDCKIYMRSRPGRDWMDGLEEEANRLDEMESRIERARDEIQEKAREKGRAQANRIVRKLDRVFTPRRLNPDDAKVLFHPIDYVVFSGMKEDGGARKIVLLDRIEKSEEHREVQRSIESAVNRGRYEWKTLRVKDDGSVEED